MRTIEYEYRTFEVRTRFCFMSEESEWAFREILDWEESPDYVPGHDGPGAPIPVWGDTVYARGGDVDDAIHAALTGERHRFAYQTGPHTYLK